jgi:hypothetical protein
MGIWCLARISRRIGIFTTALIFPGGSRAKRKHLEFNMKPAVKKKKKKKKKVQSRQISLTL